MTAPVGRNTELRLERSAAAYRRLLVAYPRPFREEYGDDLVQAFRDLMMMHTEGRGAWWRAIRDLVTSAPRQRADALMGGRRGPAGLVALVVVGLLAAVALIGSPSRSVLFMFLVVIGLPIVGINRLHRAWLVRRTTGGRVAGLVVLGVAAFSSDAVILVLAGPDRGWWIGASVALVLIVGSGLGITWGIASLTAAARSHDTSRRRPARWAIAAGVVVLGAIIGAGYNSYRNSLPPPGDHSVAQASSETRALWEAAGRGDVETVVRLAQTCADPWVQFPVGDGKHNARGYADERLLDLPDAQEAPYAEIKRVLAGTQSSWARRCHAATS
jgi:hypothetical protein